MPSALFSTVKSTFPSESSTAPTTDMPIAAKTHAEPFSRKKHIMARATASGYMK